MCRTCGVMPCRSAAASASRNAASWVELAGCCGSSEQAKWLHRPTTSTVPSAAARAAAASSSDHDSAVAPPRDSPVSASRCTRAVRPAVRAAATTSSSSHTAPTDRSIPWAIGAARSSPGATTIASTGASTPPARSASASAT